MSQTDPLIETPEARGAPLGRQGAQRRALFAAALGVGAVALSTPASAQTSFGELDASNLVLNLAYLQANFLSVATGGAVLGSTDVTGSGTAGAATGARAVSFGDAALASMAREMAADAVAHAKFLRSSASTLVIAQPAIDLRGGAGSAFGAVGERAGLAGGAGFDPYASENNFLAAAFLLKDLSVTAYAGMIDFVSTLSFAEAIAGIMAVEAHHAATLRLTLYRRGLTTPGLIEATEAISTLRDTLDGTAADLDQGVRPASSASGATVANIAPLASNGTAFRRSPQQLLNILYLNAGTATSGGFFPAGVNGALKSTAVPTPTPTPTPTPSPSPTATTGG